MTTLASTLKWALRGAAVAAVLALPATLNASLTCEESDCGCYQLCANGYCINADYSCDMDPLECLSAGPC